MKKELLCGLCVALLLVSLSACSTQADQANEPGPAPSAIQTVAPSMEPSKAVFAQNTDAPTGTATPETNPVLEESVEPSATIPKTEPPIPDASAPTSVPTPRPTPEPNDGAQVEDLTQEEWQELVHQALGGPGYPIEDAPRTEGTMPPFDGYDDTTVNNGEESDSPKDDIDRYPADPSIVPYIPEGRRYWRSDYVGEIEGYVYSDGLGYMPAGGSFTSIQTECTLPDFLRYCRP